MANRYWVGGGASANWNATGNTNWSDTSGGANNFSVPTSADDVIFDGAGTNGNDNATISATITVKSLTITTGYTATMTHNAVLTIAGNWTYVNTYTIAGTSGITINATSTITSNGVTWPNALIFDGANTKTLSGNLTVNGLLTISNTTTINKTTSETLTVAGGITCNRDITSSSTAKLILTGGTWSGSGYGPYMDIDIQGDVTLSGIVYYGSKTLTYVSGTVTTTGSTLKIYASCTLNTNGITWNNFSTVNSVTLTLTSNLSINGLFTSVTTTINKTTSETVTLNGGLTVNGDITGTSKIILTGGTWSGPSNGPYIDLDINGDVIVSGTVWYASKTLTYISGAVTTTGSTLRIYNSCTLNTSGITWNNINFYNILTATLTSNLTVNGLMTVSAATTINKTTSETVTAAGGISNYGGTISGTADIYLTGGSWTNGWNITTNLFIQGDVTIVGTCDYSTKTLTYVSGTVTTTGSTLRILGTCTLNTSGITWNNINFYNILTTTLTSNLTVNGLMTVSAATTLNKTTAETVTVAGGLTVNAALSGTAKVILTGGTWSVEGSYPISNNLDIQGNAILFGNIYYNGSSITYLTGKINGKSGTLNITGGNPTLLNFHKVPLKAVVITAGQTVTMNRFFSGTPSQICQVSSTGANYTITFQDNFEKMGRFVSVSGCTLSRPMQLLLINNQRFNTNRSTNIGLRYINQSPNGLPPNMAPTTDMTSPAMGLASDPCFVMQG